MSTLIPVHGVLATILLGCVQGEAPTPKKAGTAGLDLPLVETRKYVTELPKDEALARRIVAAMNGQGEFPDGIPDYEAALQALGRSVIPLIVEEYAVHGCRDTRLSNFIRSGFEDPLLVPILVRRALTELLSRSIDRVDVRLFDPGDEWLQKKENRQLFNCINLVRELSRASVPYLMICLKDGDPRVRGRCLDLLVSLDLHDVDTEGYRVAFVKIRDACGDDQTRRAREMVEWWQKNRADLKWDEASYRFK